MSETPEHWLTKEKIVEVTAYRMTDSAELFYTKEEALKDYLMRHSMTWGKRWVGVTPFIIVAIVVVVFIYG